MSIALYCAFVAELILWHVFLSTAVRTHHFDDVFQGVGLLQVILYVEYLTMCIALPGLSIALEDKDWDAILHYDWADWFEPQPLHMNL
jgi:hypothetical protein